ncbi:MAG: hypothetical protein U9N07_09865 [Euryarchaeota archaeon]|nr:hypothetical protein [Euryarchaeota archaeon]
MTNHNPHNHNEQRQDDCPFGYILKRALLHREDEKIDTAQHRSASPEYRITTRARINPDRAGMHCQHADCQEMRS